MRITAMSMLVDFLLLGVPAIASAGLAYRKNRSALAWATLGFLSLGMALIVLAFLPYRCKQCAGALSNREGREGRCPTCEQAQEVYVFADPDEEFTPAHATRQTI